MPSAISVFLLVISSFYFVRIRLLRYLRYLQQEGYSPSRFCSWVWEQRAFDKRGSFILLLGAAATAYMEIFTLAVATLAALTLFLIAFFEEDPRKEGKLKLKMTERATRIFRLALLLYSSASCLLAALFLYVQMPTALFYLGELVFIQLTPVWLLISNALLQIPEERLQKKLAAEAKLLLEKVHPYVIGITGSYGKTSTKEALGQLLQITLAPTYWPPKGINTPMGITKDIRARLQEGFRYAVIEMGAYGRGSINRLCALTPPNAAIITAIGTAHLERFGSVENIFLAKSELAQAIPQEGILVCNGDDLAIRRMAQENPKNQVLFYGFDSKIGPLDCWISSWKIIPQGTLFTLEWRGQKYEGQLALFGKPALANAIAAFTMACALGSDPEFAIAALRHMEPVDNRLQVQKEKNRLVLRDAYNSNPTGFVAALEVLKALPGERRIIMTPGVIELGTMQHTENQRLGRATASVCDLAIIVGKTNQKALLEGLKEGGFSDETILLCDNREAAFKQLTSLQKEGDLVLIENDLPDLYEVSPRW